MEGKELRFGPNGSVLLSVGTMGTSAGLTPAMLDSYTPIGGAMALGPNHARGGRAPAASEPASPECSCTCSWPCSSAG